MVAFKIAYAEQLFWPETGEPIPCAYFEADTINSIELDGRRPFLPNHTDQVGALIGGGTFAHTWNVLNRLQYWAFQPM